MGYVERNTWVQLLASLVGFVVYLALVVPQLLRVPVAEVQWVWPMIWTIVGAIVASIAFSIAWGIVAGARDPEAGHRADQRDREIEAFGERVGAAFLIFGALGALVLAMVQAPWFWIGQALYVGFFLSAFIGGLARLSAYHRGFQ